LHKDCLGKTHGRNTINWNALGPEADTGRALPKVRLAQIPVIPPRSRTVESAQSAGIAISLWQKNAQEIRTETWEMR
jgi:hypothetical protein